METNDTYVLILEERTEVKNEQEVGKLSVVSSIDKQGKLRTSLSMEGCESLNHHYAALDIRLRSCTLVCSLLPQPYHLVF